jgi:hypothetical protein
VAAQRAVAPLRLQQARGRAARGARAEVSRREASGGHAAPRANGAHLVPSATPFVAPSTDTGSTHTYCASHSRGLAGMAIASAAAARGTDPTAGAPAACCAARSGAAPAGAASRSCVTAAARPFLICSSAEEGAPSGTAVPKGPLSGAAASHHSPGMGAPPSALDSIGMAACAKRAQRRVSRARRAAKSACAWARGRLLGACVTRAARARARRGGADPPGAAARSTHRCCARPGAPRARSGGPRRVGGAWAASGCGASALLRACRGRAAVARARALQSSRVRAGTCVLAAMGGRAAGGPYVHVGQQWGTAPQRATCLPRRPHWCPSASWPPGETRAAEHTHAPRTARACTARCMYTAPRGASTGSSATALPALPPARAPTCRTWTLPSNPK